MIAVVAVAAIALDCCCCFIVYVALFMLLLAVKSFGRFAVCLSHSFRVCVYVVVIFFCRLFSDISFALSVFGRVFNDYVFKNVFLPSKRIVGKIFMKFIARAYIHFVTLNCPVRNMVWLFNIVVVVAVCGVCATLCAWHALNGLCIYIYKFDSWFLSCSLVFFLALFLRPSIPLHRILSWFVAACFYSSNHWREIKKITLHQHQHQLQQQQHTTQHIVFKYCVYKMA